MMGSSPVLPAECIFACCLPLERSSHERALNNTASYAAQYSGGWIQYDKLFSQEMLKTLNILERQGVVIRRDVTGQDLSEMFQLRTAKVIVLFSHWHEEQVEFADRFWSCAEIIDLIPANAKCVFDLCVCHPAELMQGLALQRSSIQICWTQIRRTPWVWLSFYESLFEVLSRGTYPYFEAFREVAIAYVQVFGVPRSKTEVR